MSSLITVTLLAAAAVGEAQSIPTTVEGAEAEARSFPNGAWPAAVSSFFEQPFGGSAERKCVAPPSLGESVPGGSLRSGEFIIRGEFTGWARFGGLGAPRANRGGKILWMPLHNPSDYRDTLVIRAARIGDAADSLRQVIPDWAWSGPKTESGFPSTMRFPTAGRWLVIATAGKDWGCFVLTVAA